MEDEKDGVMIGFGLAEIHFQRQYMECGKALHICQNPVPDQVSYYDQR